MFKISSVVATVLLVGAVVALYFLGGLFSAAPAVIILQIAAAVLMVWARVTFGLRSFHFSANPTEGRLITSGPYRYVRHPIYAAILLFVWSGVAAHLSVLHFLLALAATLGTAVRIISEEKLLREHYPEYDDYARKTRRVIPFIL